MPNDKAVNETAMTRRAFVAGSSGVAIGSMLAGGAGRDGAAMAATDAAAVDQSHQAMGTRAGEATATTAKVWARLTRNAKRNDTGDEPMGDSYRRGDPMDREQVAVLRGACPGAEGRVRLRYGTREDLGDARVTDWVEVSEAGDYSHQFDLADLTPGTVYHYESQTAGPAGSPMHAPHRGRFATAPEATATGDLLFCVMTCQMYADRDHADGHPIYPSMAKLQPSFTCLTGDLVYYDRDQPVAVTEAMARYHWQRLFSLPRLVDFNSNFGTYWLKDDHDTLRDDSGPGQSLGEFTFAQGQKIFRQQAPMSHGPAYRTFRWGRDVQVWLTDGRDYRSENRMPDGPDKTIWGAEQKAWFKKTVGESDATWKVLVSPTPLVGPDRKGKNDNHANGGFTHEGDEIRNWIREHVADHFFVVCGDRHWQYHSVHPATGLSELSVGAASNSHAGGTPGHDPAMHRFHWVKGGFLSVRVTRAGGTSAIRFELRDVDGAVVYEHKAEREV